MASGSFSSSLGKIRWVFKRGMIVFVFEALFDEEVCVCLVLLKKLRSLFLFLSCTLWGLMRPRHQYLSRTHYHLDSFRSHIRYLHSGTKIHRYIQVHMCTQLHMCTQVHTCTQVQVHTGTHYHLDSFHSHIRYLHR